MSSIWARIVAALGAGTVISVLTWVATRLMTLDLSSIIHSNTGLAVAGVVLSVAVGLINLLISSLGGTPLGRMLRLPKRA